MRHKKRKVQRYACGKVRPEGPTPEMIHQRARQVGEKDALRPEAGSLIGQWWLQGKISATERDEGFALARLRRAILSAIHAPSYSILGLYRTDMVSAPNDPEHYSKLLKVWRKRWLVVSDCGLAVCAALQRAIADDSLAAPELAKIGLEALARRHR